MNMKIMNFIKTFESNKDILIIEKYTSNRR